MAQFHFIVFSQTASQVNLGEGRLVGNPGSRDSRLRGNDGRIAALDAESADVLDAESADQFAALPASIEVRELRDTIHQDGFRPDEITIVTTLVDGCLTTPGDAEQRRMTPSPR